MSTGGYKPHWLTAYITIIGKKPSNPANTYAICNAYDRALTREETLKNLITNKKETVRNHLKQCEYFLNGVKSQEAVDAICFLTDNENETSSQSKKKKNKK